MSIETPIEYNNSIMQIDPTVK